MKTFRIIAVILMVAAAGGAIFIAFSFGRAMNQSFDFAQSQAKRGRSYMDSMTQADYQEAASLARVLMAEPAAEGSRRSLSHSDQRDVPDERKRRGVILIRYEPNRVSFGWHGGPHAHTSLELRREEDGAIAFTAHYNDYSPRKKLTIISPNGNSDKMSPETRFPAD